MDKKEKAALERLARDTAKAIRRRTQIAGWHGDESRFPETDFTDVLGMLEKVYSLGKEEAEKAAEGKHKALIDAIIDQAEWSRCSERGTMESLLEIFEPEELIALGYGDRVKGYVEEYGAEGEWDEICGRAAEHEAV